MFYRINNDHIQMSCSSLKNKKQKINEKHLRSVIFSPSGSTKYSQYIENFKQKVKQGSFYVCVSFVIGVIMMEMS